MEWYHVVVVVSSIAGAISLLWKYCPARPRKEILHLEGEIIGLKAKLEAEKTRSEYLLDRGSRYSAHADACWEKNKETHALLLKTHEAFLRAVSQPEKLEAFKEAIEKMRPLQKQNK